MTLQRWIGWLDERLDAACKAELRMAQSRSTLHISKKTTSHSDATDSLQSFMAFGLDETAFR